MLACTARLAGTDAASYLDKDLSFVPKELIVMTYRAA